MSVPAKIWPEGRGRLRPTDRDAENSALPGQKGNEKSWHHSPDFALACHRSHQWLQCFIFSSARSAQAAFGRQMRASDGTVTSSRFERRLPGGQHKLAFKVAFGTYGAAARALHVSRTTIWRWCHDLSPLPRYVAEILADIVQDKVSMRTTRKTISAISSPCRPGHRES